MAQTIEKTVKFTGGEQLIVAFNELPAEMITPSVEKAMIEALKPVAAAMASNAPTKTGKYKASFRAGKRLSPRQAAQARRTKGTDLEVYAGAGRPQSHLLEKGTKERKRKSGASTGRGPAIPHIERGWDSTKDAVLNNLRVAMGKELEKAAKKVAAK